jgi:hypothetical protein
MDYIRANSHAVFETVFDICYKPELRQEMDYIRANSHAVFETGFDICYKPEINKKWILSGLTIMQYLKPDLISVTNQS